MSTTESGGSEIHFFFSTSHYDGYLKFLPATSENHKIAKMDPYDIRDCWVLSEVVSFIPGFLGHSFLEVESFQENFTTYCMFLRKPQTKASSIEHFSVERKSGQECLGALFD